MKILITSFTFPPNMDGVAEAASAMATAFVKKGWNVEVATGPSSPSRERMEWNGIVIHEFAIYGGSKFRDPFRGDVDKYHLLLKSGSWDIIIFHSYSWMLYLAVPLLHQIPAKTIIVGHGYGALIWVPVPKFPFGLGMLMRSAFGSLLMLKWMHKIDRIVFLSNRRDFHAFYDHLLARLIGHKGIKVIPNGVDLNEFAESPADFRKEIGADVNTSVFLCVANYSRRKDQGFAARAFRMAAIKNSVLVFIGSEFNESSRIFMDEDQRDSHTKTFGRIIWMEKKDRGFTLNAVAGSDVMVLSASHEAQPFVLLEAMREGKPWIARNAGCISELPGGRVVRSESAMAKEMRALSESDNLRFEIGSSGRLAVERIYNRKTYLDSYCRMLEEMKK